MKRLKNNLILHILIAVVLSLVINFSYLLLPIITENGLARRAPHNENGAHNTGVLHLADDLYGYIICDCEQRDSVYVSSWQVRSMKLQEGDHLRFTTHGVWGDTFTEEQRQKASPRLDNIVERNGEPFDFEALYDRPSRTVEFIWQIAYYALFSFLLIQILSYMPRSGKRTRWSQFRLTLFAIVIACIGVYFAPVMSFHEGTMRIVFFFQAEPHDNAYLVVITKAVFMLVVTMLYAHIYRLMRKHQQMELENEKLKTENLSTRYNMLVGQINPHFFFNSLNSLAMLVREKDDKRALEYIDQLSYTFRYIIQNGQSSTTTLKDEIEFAEAYAYLFKIRYADKLFFDFDIDPRYNDYVLPALSLQPLIGNAVKHNSITTKNPLHVTIRTKDGALEIENPKHPKLSSEPSTGIGLENLKSRWQIIAGIQIEIIDTEETFTVRLPLANPEK